MIHRTLVLVSLISSAALGQKTLVDRFPDDWRELKQWTTAAEDPLDYCKELELTGDQFDSLYELHQQNAPGENPLLGLAALRDPLNPQEPVKSREDTEQYREELAMVYDILDDRQDKKFDQIMVQKRMAQNDLGPAIRSLASDVRIENLDEKLAELKKEINAQKKAMGVTDRAKDRDKVLPFQKKKWQLQIAWLNKHLGEAKTKDLVGAPVPVPLVLLHDRRLSRFANQRANPATGEVTVINRDFPNRPVDVPPGWTLADAKRSFDEKISEVEERREEQSKELKTVEDELLLLGRSKDDVKDRLELGTKLLVLRQEQKQFETRQTFELLKLRRIIQELGGDPDAVSDADREAGRLAKQVFFDAKRSLDFRDPRLQSHLALNADQCDKLDAISAQGVPTLFARPPLSTKPVTHDIDANAKYMEAVLAELSADQGSKFQKLAFRRLWFSREPAQAFTLTDAKLTDDHRAAIGDLRDSLIATGKRGRISPLSGRRLAREDRDDRHWVGLDKEFELALASIVGEDAATSLLGEPVLPAPNWKRPVNIPKGMTLEQAKREYENAASRADEFRQNLVPFGPNNRVDMAAIQKRMQEAEKLGYQLKIARRIYEELGGQPND